jgi:hypothetical protein
VRAETATEWHSERTTIETGAAMDWLKSRLRQLRQHISSVRREEKQINRDMEQQRYEDRVARHDAGIYERPHPYGGPGI